MSPRGEEGFALILAILALMLLTTLGISLSLTTSIELQIATNYKWSQQAFYNAEAGLEAGKHMLQSADWENILPPARTGTWTYGSTPALPVPPSATATRNFENAACDRKGGVGYGAVLAESGTNYQNVDTFLMQSVRGAFTLWVRRPVVLNAVANGMATFSDYAADSNQLVLTAEGVAPFTGAAAGGVFVQSNQARRVMETTLSREMLQCGSRAGQQGGGNAGAYMGACAELGDETLKKSLAGEAGAGTSDEIAPTDF